MDSRIITIITLLSYVRIGRCNPPHIVFIVADDLGWNDIGWHNPQMITPNLDKLANAGVILNSSYVQPLCTPSRNSFMTGYYPYHTGLQGHVIFYQDPKVLPRNLTLLPQKLKELGYATHMVGKWHLGFCNWSYTPTYRGFDSFLGYYGGEEDYYLHIGGKEPGKSGYDFRNNTDVYHPPAGEYSAHIFAARAVEIIETHNPLQQPLYLYLPFQSVHRPLQVPKKYENMYSTVNEHSRRTYCGMVSALDEAVGNITKALETHGFMDNTLIVFTSDNGGIPTEGGNNLPLRGAKGTLWEGGTKGASFVYSKTLLRKTGYINTEMIHAADWFPTLLSIAGGDEVQGIDGMNVWATLSDNQTSPRTEFIYNIDETVGNAAIRMGDYKLIEGNPGNSSDWYPLPTYMIDKTDESFGKRSNMDGYMLFNIKNDPTEHFDIADNNSDIVNKMKQRLFHYKKSLVPSQNPGHDPKSNPANYGGIWSPGWC